MPKTNGDGPPERADNEAFLTWLESIPDPERRYTEATSAMEKHQEMVRRLSELRALAMAHASEEDSVSAVARRLGVSRQRAYQLLNEAKSRTPKATAASRANRQRGKNKT